MLEHAVTLSEMLCVRDARALLQQQLLRTYHSTLICLNVNLPGPVKRNHHSEVIFAAALAAVEAVFADQISYRRQICRATGCEAYFVLPTDAFLVKQALCRIENEHALGRLFDLDVFAADGKQIGRRELAYPPRPCLLCAEDGAACARNRSHPLAELLAKIEQMVSHFEMGDVHDELSAGIAQPAAVAACRAKAG